MVISKNVCKSVFAILLKTYRNISHIIKYLTIIQKFIFHNIIITMFLHYFEPNFFSFYFYEKNGFLKGLHLNFNNH